MRSGTYLCICLPSNIIQVNTLVYLTDLGRLQLNESWIVVIPNNADAPLNVFSNYKKFSNKNVPINDDLIWGLKGLEVKLWLHE